MVSLPNLESQKVDRAEKLEKKLDKLTYFDMDHGLDHNWGWAKDGEGC